MDSKPPPVIVERAKSHTSSIVIVILGCAVAGLLIALQRSGSDKKVTDSTGESTNMRVEKAVQTNGRPPGAVDTASAGTDYSNFTGNEWVALAKENPVGALKAAVAINKGRITSLGDPVFVILKNVTISDAPEVMAFLNTLPEEFRPGQMAHVLGSAAMTGDPVEARFPLSDNFDKEGLSSAFLRGVFNSGKITVEKISSHLALLKTVKFAEAAEKLYGERAVGQSRPENVQAVLEALNNSGSGNPDWLIPAISQGIGSRAEPVAMWVLSRENLKMESDGRMVEASTINWAMADPNATATFLDDHLDIPVADAAISGLVRVLHNRDPAAADAWFEKIKSSVWRERADTLQVTGGN